MYYLRKYRIQVRNAYFLRIIYNTHLNLGGGYLFVFEDEWSRLLFFRQVFRFQAGSPRIYYDFLLFTCLVISNSF